MDATQEGFGHSLPISIEPRSRQMPFLLLAIDVHRVIRYSRPVKKPLLRALIYRHPVAIPHRKQWGSLAFST